MIGLFTYLLIFVTNYILTFNIYHFVIIVNFVPSLKQKIFGMSIV